MLPKIIGCRSGARTQRVRINSPAPPPGRATYKNKLVRAAGFEPAPYGLEDRYSAVKLRANKTRLCVTLYASPVLLTGSTGAPVIGAGERGSVQPVLGFFPSPGLGPGRSLDHEFTGIIRSHGSGLMPETGRLLRI